MYKKIAILCNKLAGSGRSVKMADSIVKHLTENNTDHTLFINDWPFEFKSFTDIFIVGGDGTMNYFINKYPTIKLHLVLFNGGTGNDFHWALYGAISFEQQLQLALTGEPRPIDIGICNDRYFINGVGVGFEAAISKALTGKKKLPGKTSFFLSVIKNIFTYKSRSYHISSGDARFETNCLLIDIYNGKRAGGGFYIAPEADPGDGLFDIIISKNLNSFQRLRYLPVIEKGKHLKLPFIKYFRGSEILVASNSLIQFHLDGEYAEAKQLDISILPSRLLFRQ